MTTLFPQIKQVDEDETSKIIKNALFDDTDELKLEKIFDELIHLTNESITYPEDIDDEIDDEDDDQEDDEESDSSSNSSKSSKSDDPDDNDHEEDDDDDEDDDEDDEDSDSSSNSSKSSRSSISSESSKSDQDERSSNRHEVNQNGVDKVAVAAAANEPLSWNLDQFIKKLPSTLPSQDAKQIPTNTSIAAAPVKVEHKPQRFESKPAKTESKQSKLEPKQTKVEPKPAKVDQPKTIAPTIATTKSPSPKQVPIPAKTTATKPIVTVKQERTPTPEPALAPTPSPALVPTPTSLSTPTTNSQTQPSNSYSIVSIDLSKLKRIPTTKVPTPQASSSSKLMTARALKHEADAERDKTKQAIKYLESAMYFVLHGHELEFQTKNITYFKETTPLFKHTLRLSNPSSESQDYMTNLKIHTLALRCLSLLHMKLFKYRERELHDNFKIISQNQNSSPVTQGDSSLVAVRPQLLSAYNRQIAIFNDLKFANDYWQKADQFCDQHAAVRIFFSTIDSNCGSLTMVSPFLKLMDHVKCGLKLLRK